MDENKKSRIYKISADYNLSAEKLIEFLKGKGYEIKSHMTLVTDEMMQDIYSHFQKEIKKNLKHRVKISQYKDYQEKKSKHEKNYDIDNGKTTNNYFNRTKINFGLIKWFDLEKGFGILASPNSENGDVFLHISNWVDKIDLNKLNTVPLVFNTSVEHNKLCAINCQYFDVANEDHWANLFSEFKLYENIKIDYKSYNLIELAIKKIESKKLLSIIDSLISKNPVFRATQIHLWEKNYIKEFNLSDEFLIDNYNLIKISTLKIISNQETKSTIIKKKLNDLKDSFNIEVFKSFQEILPLIEEEKFKDELRAELNVIGQNIYHWYFLDRLKNDMSKKASYYSIKNILTQHPSFLEESINERIRKEISDIFQKYAAIDVVIDAMSDKIIDLNDIYILDNLTSFNDNQLEQILKSQNLNLSVAKKIFDFQINKNKYEFSLSKAKLYYPDLYSELDQEIYNRLERKDYFLLWDKNISNIIPNNFLLTYFDDELSKYSKIDKWIKNSLISAESIKEILFSNVKRICSEGFKNRQQFYSVYYSIDYYIKTKSASLDIEKILNLKNAFVDLILWHIGFNESLDMNILKGKFVFFSPQHQILTFKRLFYLKYKGKIKFSFEELYEIIISNFKEYLNNVEFEKSFLIDVSTHVILEGIKNYKENGTFLFKSDLIYNDLKRNRKNKFKIESYFDRCEGRQTAKWDWHSNGKIKQVFFPNDNRKFYYAIEFEAAFQVNASNRRGQYSYYQRNPDFDLYKDEIKKIPKSKWNPEEKHWGVPSAYKEDVFEFAKRHRFFIELSNNNNYDNNKHLVVFSRINSQEVEFCEGRKSIILHKQHNREFWWCLNQECFQNSTINHLSSEFEECIAKGTKDVEYNPIEGSEFEEYIEKGADKKVYEYYTLLDILKILKIGVDETKNGNIIVDGLYYNLLNHINTYNRILEKLYCKECGELLFPANSSHFALHRVVRFQCENEDCKKYKLQVYLTNCLLGECKNIIDSRISQKCNNGLYICNTCGSCCSTEMFKNRLEYLKLTGASVDHELESKINNNAGHLEKKEYYCYKCGDMMTEKSTNLLVCDKCNIKYDFSEYHWLNKKWKNLNSRRKDYPVTHKSDDDDRDLMSYF